MKGFLRNLPIISAVAILISVVVLLAGQDDLWQLNHYIQDLSLSAHTRPVDDVVIVAIDNPSIAQLGRWPWRRSLHAEVLDRIGKGNPLVIGIDVLFTEEDEDHLKDDLILANSIQRNTPVILPAYIQTQGNMLQAIEPIDKIGNAAYGVGHAHLNIDQDGVVRSITPMLHLGSKEWLHFAAILANVETYNVHNWPFLTPSQPYIIPYAGGAHHFQYVSYVDVLHGKISPETFTGKYVLIGATAEGMADLYSTPSPGSTGLMPGVEILANVIDSMRHKLHLDTFSFAQNLAVNLAVVGLGLLGMVVLRPFRALIMSFGLAALLLGITYFGIDLGFVFYPASGLIGLFGAYILWTWYRLHIATKYLVSELRELEADGIATHRKFRIAEDFLARQVSAVEAATKELQGLHRFIRDALNTLPYPTLMADKEGIIKIVNESTLAYFPHPFIGEHVNAFLNLMTPASPNRTLAFTTHNLEQAIDSEVQDNKNRNLILKLRPVHNASGEPYGWIVSLIDISALRKAEKSREEAFQFIAHDMRAPLSSIISTIELYKHDIASTSVLDLIENQASDAIKLADEVLLLAKAESDVYTVEPVYLADLVTEVIDECWSIAQSNQITLRIAYLEAASQLYIERSLVKRAISNLVRNAIKFSPAESTVTVELRRDNKTLRFSVDDEGLGIPDPSSIFEPYARQHANSHPHLKGSGLGLAFVKAITLKHGGSVFVESKSTPGSIFHLIFPLATNG